MFKFDQMCMTHESFLNCVASTWEDGIKDHGMLWLARNLKHLKYMLWVWNREVYGNTCRQILHLEKRLAKLEVRLQEGVNIDDEQDYLVTKAKLDVWSNHEEIRLRQQAKQNFGYHKGKHLLSSTRH